MIEAVLVISFLATAVISVMIQIHSGDSIRQ